MPVNVNEILRRLGIPEELIGEISLEFGMSYSLLPEKVEALVNSIKTSGGTMRRIFTS